MKKRKLGKSGLEVSAIGLGCMGMSFAYGPPPDRKQMIDLIRSAVERGVTFFDTAEAYGPFANEELVGEALAPMRDRVVIATKFGFQDGNAQTGMDSRPAHIREVAEASLKRLRTDRIDLYQIHMQDLDTPEDEILRALDDLVTQGKVLYTGCSNYAAYRLMDSLWVSRTKNLAAFVTLQAQYSLVVREIEREHLPLCRTQGLGILCWSPLAAGFLSGKYDRGQPPPAGARLEKWKERMAGFDTPRNWNILAAIRAVAAETGATPGGVSLAWLLRRPQVSSCIFGARSVKQLEENVKAVDVVLSDGQVKQLDDASKLELGYPYAFMNDIQKSW